MMEETVDKVNKKVASSVQVLGKVVRGEQLGIPVAMVGEHAVFKKDIKQPDPKVSEPIVRNLKALNDSLIVEKMKLRGYTDSEVLLKKITVEIERQGRAGVDLNDVIKGNTIELAKQGVHEDNMLVLFKMAAAYKKALLKENADITDKERERLEISTSLQMLSDTGLYTQRELLELQIEMVKNSENVYTAAEKRIELLKLEKKLVVQINKEVFEYSKILQDSVQGSLKDLLKGEATGGDFLSNITDTFQDTQAEALSKGLTKKFFQSTGFGEMFGQSMSDLEHIFDSAPEKGARFYEQAIITSSRIGAQMYIDAFSGAKGTGTGGGGATGGGTAGMINQLSGMFSGGGGTFRGLGGQMTANVGSNQVATVNMGGAWVNGKYVQGAPGGAGMSGGAVKASQTASMSSMASKGMSVVGAAMTFSQMYKLKGTGNVWGGASQGGMAGYQAGSVLGPVGGVVGAIAGAIYGAFKGGQVKTTEEIANQTREVSSRIDVTNKKLSMVNRNLIALSDSITFIMKESAYFSEATNLTDEFSINSSRGIS